MHMPISEIYEFIKVVSDIKTEEHNTINSDGTNMPEVPQASTLSNSMRNVNINMPGRH